jgi:FKBP-type peptidyl-prolyl cis-trans isomerase
MPSVSHVCIATVVAISLAIPASAQNSTIPKNGREKVSYGIGVETARTIKAQRLDIDVDMIIQGLRDELTGKKLAVPNRELRRLMTMFRVEQRKQDVENTVIAAENNAKRSEAFLTENKGKAGVVILPSGLQYRIVAEGSGKKPKMSDSVQGNFVATLADGTEFDSSEPGQPATLRISQTIPGLREALLLMPAGSKWQIVIPPHLAYGSRGFGRTVGPNEVLVYEFELVSIK